MSPPRCGGVRVRGRRRHRPFHGCPDQDLFPLAAGVRAAAGGEPGPRQYAELINAIAAENGVDPSLVKAIIRAESNFDRRAISRKGAQGLMQLMPGTAGRYAVGNTFDPAENIRGGVRHLRSLQDRFPGQLHLAVAAYNPGRVPFCGTKGFPRTPRRDSTWPESFDSMTSPTSCRWLHEGRKRRIGRRAAQQPPRSTDAWDPTEPRNTATYLLWSGPRRLPDADRSALLNSGLFLDRPGARARLVRAYGH